MRTLIAYATKYGGTRTCAEKLSKMLPGDTDLLELSRATAADLSPYDAVIVGTSVYMGKPRKEAVSFCERNRNALLTKKLGLFLCCIQDQDKVVAQQLSMAFPQKLRMHAVAAGALGGVIEHSKLNRLDALLMKMIGGRKAKVVPVETVNTLSNDAFDRFLRVFLG